MEAATARKRSDRSVFSQTRKQGDNVLNRDGEGSRFLRQWGRAMPCQGQAGGLPYVQRYEPGGCFTTVSVTCDGYCFE